MKKLFKLLIALIIIFFGGITLYKLSKENESMIAIIEYYTRENSVLENNKWQNENPNNYVKFTTNFYPTEKKDLLDIYYTILASGMNEFTFYCDINYSECINDVKELTRNNTVLSNINGFVHVYNSYTSISTEFKNNGKVTLKVSKLYTDELINKIDTEVNRLFNELYNKDKTIRENLKIFHDYIIDHTKYDLEYIEHKTDRLSNTAYAPLFDGYAICSGYTDLMALILYKLDIDNIRVSNETHTWNMLYIDGEKLIIDLTYDDPVTHDKTDIKRDTYFLISNEDLVKLDNDHFFSEEVFLK